jgi:hypothetical protein
MIPIRTKIPDPFAAKKRLERGESPREEGNKNCCVCTLLSAINFIFVMLRSTMVHVQSRFEVGIDENNLLRLYLLWPGRCGRCRTSKTRAR